MPLVGRAVHSDEEYAEWLGRMEEEEALPQDYEAFQERLKSELDLSHFKSEGSMEAAISKLYEIMKTEEDWEVAGIHPLGTREAWGWHQRYYIEGLKGLWGWESAQSFYEGWKGA